MKASAQAAAAERLMVAARTGRPCKPVRDLLPPGDVGAAYAVQQIVNSMRKQTGSIPSGRKIGLTNTAVQAQLGVAQPDFGVLFDDMAWPPGLPVPYDRLLQPRVEAEIAFVLGADQDGAGPLGAPEAAVAVRHAVAALEIVDSRVVGWDIGIVDTIADNASSGLYVLGAAQVALDQFDPVAVAMTMTRNSEPVSSGTGADCLGDPLEALAWLARTARELGSPLRAGDVVLSGALGPMVDVRPGDHVHAQITGLGAVHAEFTARADTAKPDRTQPAVPRQPSPGPSPKAGANV